MDPKGKIALVTGAAQGIGFAITKALLQNGVKGVTLIDVNVPKGESALEQFQKEFGKEKAIFMKTDVSNEDELEDAFKKTIEHFGGLDIVVNNAAVFNGKDWKKMVSINVNGVFSGTVLALKYLGKDQLGKGGVVINTGSESGLGNGSDVAPHYNGTKGAVIAFTRTFSSDFLWQSTGVRVMCINPGYTETGIVAPNMDMSTFLLKKEWLPQLQKELQSRPPPQSVMDPKGKTALVTGAVQGIGLAITKELLRQGVKGVSVCDVNAMKGMIVIQELQEEFGKERVIFIKTDVTNEKEVEDAFKETLKKFDNLDIVVNNAGICDESNWKGTVNVNMNGVIQGNLMALKYMGKTRGGSGGVVVNVASVGGLVSIAAVAIYSATKSGIIALSRSLGCENLNQVTGVRVMAICPDATDTEILSGLTNNELIPVDIGTVMSSNHSEIQKTESVSKGILHIIREGNPGSIWISAKDKPVYEIKIPFYEDLKV